MQSLCLLTSLWDRKSWGAMPFLKVSHQRGHLQNIQFGPLGLKMLESLHALKQREAGVTAAEPHLHPFSLLVIYFWNFFYLPFYFLIFQTFLLRS